MRGLLGVHRRQPPEPRIDDDGVAAFDSECRLNSKRGWFRPRPRSSVGGGYSIRKHVIRKKRCAASS